MKQNEKGKNKAKPAAAENNGDVVTSKSLLKSFLKTHKDDHYNFEDPVKYKVSSGSLLLDYFTNGGLNPGLHRFCGINEGGKQLSCQSKIKTPNGWTTHGEVKVGDEVSCPDGTIAEVVGVYPQGKQDIYRFNFGDGVFVDSGLEHLWKAFAKYDDNEPRWKIVSTKYLLTILEKGPVFIPFISDPDVFNQEIDLVKKGQISVINSSTYVSSKELLSITKLDNQEECVCIMIDHKDHLYITDHYIVTHNTAASLQFMKNFLDKSKGRKGLYIKAEGKLPDEMIERSGVKFVFDEDKWEEGTCFVYESNIYESVVELMRDLVGNNPEKINYFFLLDSVDGLMRRGDRDKTFEESAKVAGGAVIASDFMKRVSISLQKRGHIAVFISQVRADIKLDPYSKAPIRQTTATGGNALLHYANWIFEFEGRFKGDQIMLDDKKPYNEQENPILGHVCKITVKKSPNERTNCVIRYPIRYGRKNGTSNWIEKEIFDFLLMWELAVKKGAWIMFDEELLTLLKESGIEDFPAQIQGAPKFEALINGNEKLKNFFVNYISNSFLNFTSGIEVKDTEKEEEAE